jgi:hypothetical protein
MSSHTDDDAVESCWRQRCRGDLVATRYTCRVMLTMVLSSHASDGAARVNWPRYNVDAESCWRRCCQVMLKTALPERLGHDTM